MGEQGTQGRDGLKVGFISVEKCLKLCHASNYPYLFFHRAIKGQMVFKEWLGLEAARWAEKTNNAPHHGG